MPSSGMLCHVALVRTDALEELSASIIRVFLCSLHQLLIMADTPSSPIVVTLVMEALRSSKRRFLQDPHGVTSQKTAFFNVEFVYNPILFAICANTITRLYKNFYNGMQKSSQ
jgi:hypothetical protein